MEKLEELKEEEEVVPQTDEGPKSEDTSNQLMDIENEDFG